MELNYRAYGDNPDSTLIVVHGLMGSLDNWHSLCKRWGDDHKVYAVDLRNHGKSPHHPDMDYVIMAHDLHEFMQQHDIETATLLGHSMGGKVVMQFAAFYPERIDRLIVADMAPKVYGDGHSHIFKALFDLKPETITSRSEADERFAELLSDEDAGVRLFLLKNLIRTKNGNYRFKMNLEGIYDNYQNILRNIETNHPVDCPTLFVRGEKSRYVRPDKDRDLLDEYFTDYRLETIPDAGHWLHAEQPDLFYECVHNDMNPDA